MKSLRVVARSAVLDRFRIASHAARRVAHPAGKYLDHVRYRDVLPSVVPLNVDIDPALADTPTLNVLLPGMALYALSGGPNTVINLVYRLAAHGVRLRFISTDVPKDSDHRPLYRHFASLTGLPADLPNVSIVDGSDRSRPIRIGLHDRFFASAWWNVQMIKAILPRVAEKRFFYIIQDYEPGLYPLSTRYALALDTYSLDYHGIICSHLLAGYMFDQKVGRFADPAFQQDCDVFEPAVDRRKFFPVAKRAGPRRLLFYARPTMAERNLFELGLYALRAAVSQGCFDNEPWEFRFIGEPVPAVELDHGYSIEPLPWMGYDEYANTIRTSDIVLSLMLSPHTSYPPIEAAASGVVALTNVFANKTAERLRDISPNIIGVPASPEGVTAGLKLARERVIADEIDRGGVKVPSDWSESFSATVPSLLRKMEACRAPSDV